MWCAGLTPPSLRSGTHATATHLTRIPRVSPEHPSSSPRRHRRHAHAPPRARRAPLPTRAAASRARHAPAPRAPLVAQASWLSPPRAPPLGALLADERGLVAVEVVEPQAPEHPRLPHAVPPAEALLLPLLPTSLR